MSNESLLVGVFFYLKDNLEYKINRDHVGMLLKRKKYKDLFFWEHNVLKFRDMKLLAEMEEELCNMSLEETMMNMDKEGLCIFGVDGWGYVGYYPATPDISNKAFSKIVFERMLIDD